MDPHTIHRLHDFLPHLAARQPDLLGLLPPEERPVPGTRLEDWVVSLPQRRLMEICSVWVLQSLTRLRVVSPLTNVLLRACLHLAGEFDQFDAEALAVGEPFAPGNPRREEIRRALDMAVRAGLLIHVVQEDHYCVPFPVRLSLEGVEVGDPMERELHRMRLVAHFATIAAPPYLRPEFRDARHWRFPNMLAALEQATALMEEWMGLEPGEWVPVWQSLRDVPPSLARPLSRLGCLLGRALVARHSDGGERLLAAALAGATSLDDADARGQLLGYMGQFHLRRNRHRAALAVYTLAEDHHRAQRHPQEEVLAISAQAFALRELGQWLAAAATFGRAAAVAMQAALADEELHNLNCAAETLCAISRPGDAVTLLETAVARLGEFPSPGHGELLLRLGAALRQAGDHEAAGRRLEQAVVEARAHGHLRVESEACLELAFLHRAIGLPDEALRWARRARTLFGAVPDHAGIARTELFHYQLLTPAERDREGDALLGRALRHAQGANDHEIEAQVWRERRHAAADRGEESTAISWACREIDALRHTWNTTALLEAHLALARLYNQRGATLAAAADALRAQAIARTVGGEHLGPEDLLFIEGFAKLLPADQFDFIVQQVTDELDAGELVRQR
jgi:tetratricopeptide (TPR) repeat protein